jgi:RNA polymerase sigma-70 factor (TIGR02960 family)
MDMSVISDPSQDSATFTALAERHRAELQIHCYRMLGSFDEAEDQVQETFLRAWRRRETYAGRASMRAWLYGIATNACLDALDRRPRTPDPVTGEVAWLSPCPDSLLDELPAPGEGPHAEVAAKETIELAYLVAIQHLPPLQRAVLVLRDVLGWPARDTAAMLDTTVASANSALQRARQGLQRHLPEQRTEWAPGADATAAERALVERYLEASEQGDVEAFLELLRDDASFTMPPHPGVWKGAREIIDGWVEGGFGTPGFRLRCTPTRVNRQPAVACWVLGEDGVARALAVDVLRIADGRVADIVTFDKRHFGRLGLPEVLG